MQASAPPEAELYQGTDDLSHDSNIPVAAAVLINDEPITTGSSYHHNHHGSSSSYQDESATTATAVGSPALLHNNNNNETVYYLTDLGLKRQRITCPYCHGEGLTNVQTVIDGFTVICCGILFLLFWPVCWLPLVLPGCKVAEHYCSSCHRRVGVVPACAKGCGACGC